MTIQPNDPWQDAADQASGMEGVLVRHNCKTGAATVDGAEVGPDFRMCLFLEVAFHGWLKFEDNQLVDKDLRRFANEAPDPKEQGTVGSRTRPAWDSASRATAVLAGC
jgi:hypothetical protein